MTWMLKPSMKMTDVPSTQINIWNWLIGAASTIASVSSLFSIIDGAFRRLLLFCQGLVVGFPRQAESRVRSAQLEADAPPEVASGRTSGFAMSTGAPAANARIDLTTPPNNF